VGTGLNSTGRRLSAKERTSSKGKGPLKRTVLAQCFSSFDLEIPLFDYLLLCKNPHSTSCEPVSQSTGSR